MSNTHQVLIVGAVDCNDQNTTFLKSWSLGKPARMADEYGGLGIDIAKVGVVDMSGLVESRFVVSVKGASVDAVTSTVAAISAELAALAPITVGLKNSAHTGTLQPRATECVEIPQESPWDSRLVNANATQIEIIVRRDPYVRAAVETLHSAVGFDCPVIIPLTNQTGQFATPLELLLDAGALEMYSCYVGHMDDEAAVIGDFVKQPLGGAWSAGAGAADAAGYPNGVGNTIQRHTGVAYTDVDVTGLPPGEYLPLVNCKGTTANTDTVRHAYCDPVLIPTTTLKLLPLPVVTLPCAKVRGAAASTLRFTITGGGGSEYAAVNYITLVPVSDGLIGWRVPSGHAHRVLWTDGTMYVEDEAKPGEAYGSASPLRTLGGHLVVIAEQATPAPTTRLRAIISATPRWEQFPSDSAPETLAEFIAAGELEVIFPATPETLADFIAAGELEVIFP